MVSGGKWWGGGATSRSTERVGHRDPRFLPYPGQNMWGKGVKSRQLGTTRTETAERVSPLLGFSV